MLVPVILMVLVQVSEVVLGMRSYGVGLEVLLIVLVSIKWYKSFNVHVIGARSVVMIKYSVNIGIMSVCVDSGYGSQGTGFRTGIDSISIQGQVPDKKLCPDLQGKIMGSKSQG